MAGTTPKLQLPFPTNSDTVDVPRDISALATKLDNTVVPSAQVPVGALLLWPTAIPPNANWLLCNGAQVDAATYATLATVLGSSAGKITLPNLAGRFPFGAIAAHPLNQTGGAETVALTTAQLAAHTHPLTVTEAAHNHSMDGASAGGQAPSVTGGRVMTSGGVVGNNGNMVAKAADTGFYGSIGVVPTKTNLSVAAANAGGGTAHENLPPYLAINFIIRAL